MNPYEWNSQLSRTSHCKIGRVRLKGGAQLHLIKTRTSEISEQISGFIEMDAGYLADATEQLAGYFMVTWDRSKRVKFEGFHSNELVSLSFEELSLLLNEASSRWILQSIVEEVQDDDADGEMTED